MKTYRDNQTTVLFTDAITGLRSLEEKSFHACVCSPPYFGLRSYLDSDHADKSRELGSEETPERYVENLVEVFREVWRVLRDDSLLFLNLGDCYRNKQLLQMPHRVSFALQDDGWILRSAITWTKANVLPESVRDRPTSSYEMVFMLSKKPRYFYDAEAVRENMASSSVSRLAQDVDNQIGTTRANGRRKTNGNLRAVGDPVAGRNARNVWNINPTPYSESHFAVFPVELPMRCIRAATSEYGVCSAMIQKLKVRDDLSENDMATVKNYLTKRRLV